MGEVVEVQRVSARPAESQVAPSATGALALQRQIGNRATARLLQRDPPRSRLADFLPNARVQQQFIAEEQARARSRAATGADLGRRALSEYRRLQMTGQERPVVAVNLETTGPPPTESPFAAAQHEHHVEVHLQAQVAIAGSVANTGLSAGVQPVIQVVWQFHDSHHWGPEFSIGVQGNAAVGVDFAQNASASSGWQANLQFAIASAAYHDARRNRVQEQFFAGVSAGHNFDVPASDPQSATHPFVMGQVGVQHAFLLADWFQVFLQATVGGGVTTGQGGLSGPVVPFAQAGVAIGGTFDWQVGGDR